MKLPRSTRPRGGFTLLELVIVMTIMAVLVGVVAPVGSTMLNRAGRKATLEELEVYAAAVEDYFEDTGALPSEVMDLVADDGSTGWAGPYLTGAVTDAGAASTDFEADAWNNPYTVTISGDTWTLASRGVDRVVGGGDDLSVVVDVSGVRRRQTEERLAVINTAVQNYNDYWLEVDAGTGRPVSLADDWDTARTRLVSTGFLSNASEYATDAWGDDFVRVGTSGPPDRFESAHF